MRSIIKEKNSSLNISILEKKEDGVFEFNLIREQKIIRSIQYKIRIGAYVETKEKTLETLFSPVFIATENAKELDFVLSLNQLMSTLTGWISETEINGDVLNAKPFKPNKRMSELCLRLFLNRVMGIDNSYLMMNFSNLENINLIEHFSFV